MSEGIPHELSAKEAAGMTVNERLWLSGLMMAYDDAIARQDTEEMTAILKGVHLDEKSIEANIHVAIEGT
jgi:hypothetical protein